VTQLGVLKQPLEPGKQGTGVSGFNEECVRSLVGELENPTIGDGERGQTRAHRFEERVAERFGAGREHEEIGGGIGLTQSAAMPKTGQVDSGHRMTLQVVSQGPLPYQHQLSIALPVSHTAPGIQQAAQIFFLGQASDVGHQEIIGTDPE